MLKIIQKLSKFFLLTVFVALFYAFLGNFNQVKADCVCLNWDYSSWPCTVYDASGNPTSGWCSSAVCLDNNSYNGCSNPSCGPGTYPCNRASDNYCCPQDEPQPTTNPGCQTNCCSGCSCTNSCTNPTTCTQTAPTNLTTTRLSSTSVQLNWTPGTPGGTNPYQALYVSTNSNPQTGCAGTSGGTAACPLKLDSSTTAMTSTQASYTVSNLAANTVYYWTVMNVQDANCASYTTSSAPYVSSCSVSPSSLTLNQGTSQTLTSSVNSSTGIIQVGFVSSNGSQVSVNPATDTTYSYQTLVTGVSQTTPTATVTQNVYVTGGSIACSQDTTVTVVSPEPWWQVVDSDVTSNTDINSSVPAGEYFGLSGAGGYPGIPAYLATTNLSTSNSSSVGWLAQSGVGNPKVFDYQYFNNQVPDDTIVTTINSSSLDQAAIDSNITPSYGYYWYRYSGAVTGLDLNVNTSINIGSKKVILLVDSATVNIAAPITLTNGQGFFMMVVGKASDGTKGNITINPALGGNPYDLEGIYLADGTFSTGVAATQFKVRGSVVGYDGINLQRDLGVNNGTTPAEVFEYAPDQILLFSSTMGTRKINWKEVAP